VTNARLLRMLVPDLPAHRRTESDSRAMELAARANAWASLRERAIEPGLQRPSLVSSYDGSIEEILFAFPSNALANVAQVAAYRSVIAALRPGTRFVIVHHDVDGARELLQSWFRDAGHPEASVRYTTLPHYVTFTDWAEDAYVALHDAADGSAYLMEPWQFPRAGDALLAEAVAELGSLRAAQAPMIFQGGNCLVGDTFWLLGKDYVADTRNLLLSRDAPVRVPNGTTAESFIHTIARDYVDKARELMIVGTTRPIPLRSTYGRREDSTFVLDLPSDGAGAFQPIFHIDMFITLFGRDAEGRFQVRVGSPKLGARLLGTTAPFALDEVYDAIADDLANRGMTVTRNPLVHRATIGGTRSLTELRNLAQEPDGEELRAAVDELIDLGAGPNTSIQVRHWHHVTWNNCLVEVSRVHGKHVYLPTFGHGANADLAVVDDAMRALWESDGFKVHLLGDFNQFARRQGVVHCIKKYLARGD
jgi:hypothetical protein